MGETPQNQGLEKEDLDKKGILKEKGMVYFEHLKDEIKRE